MACRNGVGSTSASDGGVDVSGYVMAVRAVAEVGSHKRTAQRAQLVGGEFVGGDGGADVGHEAGTCAADVAAVDELGHARFAPGGGVAGADELGHARFAPGGGVAGADGVGCGLCGVTDPGKLNAGDRPVLALPQLR